LLRVHIPRPLTGIGKTAPAVHIAHRIAGRYPDGQLFIDLHGYTQGMQPVGPADALDHLLRSLGVTGAQIPSGVEERAALYRTRLADRRMLILLDNAAAEAQVAPLLPGAAGCLVLVTSRRRLAGLDHTHTLSLDTLPPTDAVSLFIRTAGEDRFSDAPPDVLAELVELCGRLPLAVRIAGARLRSHPAWNPGHLVQRLRDQHRLGELAAGQRSITAALDLSYQHLSAELRRTYRLLGLHFGPDLDGYAVAALLDATLPEAGRLLEQLLEAHLLQEPLPGRYRFHDLTRAHATDTATRDETEHSRRGAIDRLLDHYRHTASLAMDTAHPYERERRPQVPPAHTPSPALPNPPAALQWLDAELPNLMAAANYATDHDRPAHLLHLSTLLHRHLRTRGAYHEAETLHHQALVAARATGHQAAEVEALLGLGHLLRIQGQYDPAAAHLRQALELAHATGHQTAEPDALVGLAHIHLRQGRYEQAANLCQPLLDLVRVAGNLPAELDALIILGWARMLEGRYGLAADYLRRAVDLGRATGYRPGELEALASLGHVRRRQRRYGQATDHFEQALQLARATGHRPIEAALAGLGGIDRLHGRYEKAADDYQQLLDVTHQSGDRNWQFEAWQGLGRLHHYTGHPDVALTHHRRALALATELDQPDDQARAHDGLAHAHHALHQREQARSHWQHALAILTDRGIDHTDDEETNVAAIHAHLRAIADTTPQQVDGAGRH